MDSGPVRPPPGLIERAIVAYAWRASDGGVVGMPDRGMMRVDDRLFTAECTRALAARLVPLPSKVECRDELLAVVAHVMVVTGPRSFLPGVEVSDREAWFALEAARRYAMDHVVTELAETLVVELFL